MSSVHEPVRADGKHAAPDSGLDRAVIEMATPAMAVYPEARAQAAAGGVLLLSYPPGAPRLVAVGR